MSRQMTPEYQRNKPKVLARDNYACYLCGDEATVADHIIPWSLTQDDSMENLSACCALCNNRKQDKLYNRISWWNPKYLEHL